MILPPRRKLVEKAEDGPEEKSFDEHGLLCDLVHRVAGKGQLDPSRAAFICGDVSGVILECLPVFIPYPVKVEADPERAAERFAVKLDQKAPFVRADFPDLSAQQSADLGAVWH
jgi:hypothetical protein